AAAGHEAERQIVPFDAVQGLVEAAVPREDDQRVRLACLTCELDRMARTFAADGADVSGIHELPLDGGDGLLRDPTREWVDDQNRTFHCPRACHDSTMLPSRTLTRTVSRRSTSSSSAPGSSAQRATRQWHISTRVRSPSTSG